MAEIKKDDTNDTYFPEGTEHKEVISSMGSRDFIWDEAKK